MQTISFVSSTFNEEENIRSCLDSVKDFVDEIVIVDGTSTDNTVEIAREYGAKVVVTSNPTIFLINRQKAIDLATKDWIFQLDADEHATPELLKEIKDVLNNEDAKKFNGYRIPRKNYFLGRFLIKGGQYPDYQIRFYRRGKAHFLLKDVHEQAIIDGKIGVLSNAMLHFPYIDFSFYLKKWNRYNNVFAMQIRSELKRAWIGKRIYKGLIYLVINPIHWFLLTYIRHKGFMDSWQGFVFSLFSSLRFPVAYIKQALFATIES